MNTILWGNVNINLLSISGLTAVDRNQRNAHAPKAAISVRIFPIGKG